MPFSKCSTVFLMVLALSAGHGSEANITAADISFSTIKLVDQFSGLDQPASRSAALEELVAQSQTEHAASIAPPGAPSKRARFFLRVDFHSTVDFQAVANREALVSVHTFFCGRRDDFVVLGAPTVYFGGSPIHANELPKPQKPVGGYTYAFYLNPVRRENRSSNPPQMGFDLRVSPENVCFYVTGSGTTGLIYTSTTAVVPKEAIVAAINQLGPD
jgi:hypothetical protein